MFDYSLTKDDKKLYILKHEKIKDGNEDKIAVHYADGSIDIIDDLDDNLDIIEVKKDEQIEEALSFSNKIKKRIKRSIACGMTLSTSVCVGGSILMANMPVDNQAKYIAVAGLGVIYFGSIFYSMKKNEPVEELDKLKFLEENRDDLELYNEYNNSLNGLDNKTRHLIRSRNNPYSSLFIEDYDLDTLQTIEDNIERAKYFDYKSKKKR